jgi:2-keto-4-pentenoate hydratase/2-oxohepta-3-ene-1,7-dioic acid hydratase in catechol pathway
MVSILLRAIASTQKTAWLTVEISKSFAHSAPHRHILSKRLFPTSRIDPFHLETRVHVQQGNTKDMIFSVDK